MAGTVTYETQGEIAIITNDNPPVNVLSSHIHRALAENVKKAEADDAIKAIVIIGSGKAFSAGADITEFDALPDEATLTENLDIIEGCSKPIVAGINGVALGGGLELALGCHYRVATAKSLLGLPEVKLGIIPGAGGTQRLPRVVGAEAAIKMICTGNPVTADKMVATGLINELVEGDIKQAAVTFIKSKISQPFTPVSARSEWTEKDKANKDLFDAARAEYKKKSRGQLSPQGCIDAIEASIDLPFAEGLKKEYAIFEELVVTNQSKALRHIFFAEREAKKIPGIGKQTPVREIKSAAVLGAGTMGGGIAMNFVNAGMPVTIIEHSQEALDKGLALIRKNYESTAKKGRMTMEAVEKCMSLITGTLSREDAKDADLIIEAVFENMDLKKEIFTDLDRIAKPGAILASNTSTLDINVMASVTSRPEDFIGLHFFSPANIMPLLEIVRGEKTSDEVIATSMKLAGIIRKLPVLVGVCDGFVGNRMVGSYGDHARVLLMEGALPEQVDGAIQKFGMAMGPFAMSDLAGVDITWRIRQEKGEKEAVGDKLYELGRLGQKTGSGYYNYVEGSRVPQPDPVVKEIIENASAEAGITRREISDEEILNSCLLALANEGAKILEEGIALRASDIDVIYANGYGFPRFEAGPMFWLDTFGLDKALELIKKYNAQYPDAAYWTPAPLIEKLAAEGKTFADFDKENAKG